MLFLNCLFVFYALIKADFDKKNRQNEGMKNE